MQSLPLKRCGMVLHCCPAAENFWCTPHLSNAAAWPPWANGGEVRQCINFMALLDTISITDCKVSHRFFLVLDHVLWYFPFGLVSNWGIPKTQAILIGKMIILNHRIFGDKPKFKVHAPGRILWWPWCIAGHYNDLLLNIGLEAPESAKNHQIRWASDFESNMLKAPTGNHRCPTNISGLRKWGKSLLISLHSHLSRPWTSQNRCKAKPGNRRHMTGLLHMSYSQSFWALDAYLILPDASMQCVIYRWICRLMTLSISRNKGHKFVTSSSEESSLSVGIASLKPSSG